MRQMTQYSLAVRVGFGRDILDATFGRMHFTQLSDMQPSPPFVPTSLSSRFYCILKWRAQQMAAAQLGDVYLLRVLQCCAGWGQDASHCPCKNSRQEEQKNGMVSWEPQGKVGCLVVTMSIFLTGMPGFGLELGLLTKISCFMPSPGSNSKGSHSWNHRARERICTTSEYCYSKFLFSPNLTLIQRKLGK